MYWSWPRSILLGCVLLAPGVPAWAQGGEGLEERAAALPVLKSHDLAKAAEAPMGGHLRVVKVERADTGESAAFELERFQVFAGDATVTVHTTEEDFEVLPPPAVAYFRGVIEGRPGSRVFLSVLEDGASQGIVTEGDATYLIGGEGTAGGGDFESRAAFARAGAPLTMHRVDPKLLKSSSNGGFTCGNEGLPAGQGSLADDLDLALASAAASTTPAIGEATVNYTARVAVETDYEFYTRFNNSDAATTYIGNLIGYASLMYVNEINTSLVVQSVSLWTTSSDPWSQTGSLCALLEFGRYWNINRTGVSRTIAHMMSGRGTGGGVAWLGVLCSGAFNYGTSCPGLPTDAFWGGGYGFTGSLSGGFDISSPSVMWDIMGVSHEIGHNFNSPHTHCYNGIGGNSSPVDQCYNGEAASGCYSGAQSLPGPAGAGSGTLMSYCHLSGGYSNMTLTLGTNHPYGVLPGRVPSRMSAHVVSRASSNPSCLAPATPPNSIFSNGFEAGSTSGWQ